MGKTFRYISYEDTVKLDIHMKDVVPVFEQAYRLVAEGTTTFPGRVRLVNPPLMEGFSGKGRPWTKDLRIIPAIVPGMGTACRLGATARGKGGGVLLVYWADETMDLLSVISDYLVHAVRSTAPDGAMTKYLAREDSTILAVIGTGRLARWAAEAAWSQRPIKTMRVYSRDPRNREEFCAYMSQRLGVETVNCSSNDEAVTGADVVVMATSTLVPVINGSALKPGCTVITNTPEELDKDTVRRVSRIVSSSALGAENHVPPFQAIAELREAGELPRDKTFDDLCDVIVGRKPRRVSEDEIIIGLNPAHGAHDVAAAKFTYERALQIGLGTDLPV